MQMTSMDFGNNFGGGLGNDFNAASFGVGPDEDIINYGDFLNDGDNNLLVGDIGLWDELTQDN